MYIILEFIFHQICEKNPCRLFSCVLQIAVLSRVVSLVVDGSGPFLQNVLTHANSTLLPYYGNHLMKLFDAKI